MEFLFRKDNTWKKKAENWTYYIKQMTIDDKPICESVLAILAQVDVKTFQIDLFHKLWSGLK